MVALTLPTDTFFSVSTGTGYFLKFEGVLREGQEEPLAASHGAVRCRFIDGVRHGDQAAHVGRAEHPNHPWHASGKQAFASICFFALLRRPSVALNENAFAFDVDYTILPAEMIECSPRFPPSAQDISRCGGNVKWFFDAPHDDRRY